MFLKLTLYTEEEVFNTSMMINMDKVVAYGDVWCFNKKYDAETKRTIESKTFGGCLIEFDNGKTIKVVERVEEINLKMAQLERRRQW